MYQLDSKLIFQYLITEDEVNDNVDWRKAGVVKVHSKTYGGGG